MELGLLESLDDLKKLLVLGPSFRRRMDPGPLQAIQRFDGLFYRVARKYLQKARDVDVLIMKDDLTLVDEETLLPYNPPEGESWGKHSVPEEAVEKARKSNESVLSEKLKSGRYSEVFLAMGKKYAEAFPDISRLKVKVVFPATGGPGPKAQALKEWIRRGRINT